MPINLAGGYAAGGVHDALLEIVKQRMLEQELAQRQEEAQFQRLRANKLDARQEAQDAYTRSRNEEQDRIAAETRKREAEQRHVAMLTGRSQQEIDTNLGFDTSTARMNQVPTPKGIPETGLPSYQPSMQTKPLMVEGVPVRPKSAEQIRAADQQKAIDDEMFTGVTLGTDQTRVIPGVGIIAQGKPAEDVWEPITLSINGQNVQLERNKSGGYRTPITHEPVSGQVGPKQPDRDPLAQAIGQQNLIRLQEMNAPIDPATLAYMTQQVKQDGSLFINLPPKYKPAVLDALASQGIDINKISAGTKFMKETATQVLPMIDQVSTLAKQINELGLMGTVGGRWRSLVNGESSASDIAGLTPQQRQLVGKFVSEAGLLNSAIARAHGGARAAGSPTMIQQTEKLIGAADRDLNTYLGALEGGRAWMQNYAGTTDTPGGGPDAQSALDAILKANAPKVVR